MASRWYYQREGQEMHGPCTPQEMKQLAASGQLLESDRVRREDMAKLMRAGRVKGLFVTPPGQGPVEKPSL